MTKKHKHKGKKTAAIIILVLVLILGYLGLVPGLSWILGANKPRDLGVKWTEEDAKSMSAKMGRERATFSDDAPETSIRFEGSHKVDTLLTQEEITANMETRPYKYNPVKNFQGRINDDGSVEISGNLVTRNLRDYGKAAKVPEDEAEMILDKISFISDPAFYAKGTFSVTDNQVDLDIDQATVGRIPVPVGMVPMDTVERFAEERIQNIPGLYIESYKVEDEKVRFKGTYPDKSLYSEP